MAFLRHIGVDLPNDIICSITLSSSSYSKVAEVLQYENYGIVTNGQSSAPERERESE